MNYIIMNQAEFGFALLKARRLRRMNQVEVAWKVGVTATTIGAIEMGKSRPNSKTERGLQKLFPEVFE